MWMHSEPVCRTEFAAFLEQTRAPAALTSSAVNPRLTPSWQRIPNTLGRGPRAEREPPTCASAVGSASFSDADRRRYWSQPRLGLATLSRSPARLSCLAHRS